VTRLVLPEGPGVRVDSGIEAGDVVDAAFDSLLAKLIVTGADRAQALERSRRALDELAVEGVVTVAAFHRAVVRDPAFTADSAADFAIHTRWIETGFRNGIEPADGAPPGTLSVPIGGRRMAVTLPGLASLGAAGEAIRSRESAAGPGRQHGDAVTAPMRGTVIKVAVEEGQQVEAGEVIAVVEAMKMENPVTAHKAGVVTGLRVTVGEPTVQDQVLCRLE
jgi:acetyl-CoA/propionyl-CoA carboxylase biotin carboxyl carrier protein